jgi:hypothetical protein
MHLLALLPLISLSTAHYVFPALIAAGTTTAEWKYVRQWTGYYSNGPVTDVTSPNFRCNVDASSPAVGAKTSTLSVTAGGTLGFTAKASISHPGPMQVYMAKVPEGQTASSWDGSGSVWFKIFGQGPNFGGSLTWPTQGISFHHLLHLLTNGETKTGMQERKPKRRKRRKRENGETGKELS